MEDTDSDTVRGCALANENYSFEAVAEGTHLVVVQAITDEFASDMNETWPKALARLKSLCKERIAA